MTKAHNKNTTKKLKFENRKYQNNILSIEQINKK